MFTVEVFNLLNTQISLPIAFTFKSWDFELGYSVNLPNAVANESNLPTTSFFSLSAGYLFDLSKFFLLNNIFIVILQYINYNGVNKIRNIYQRAKSNSNYS